MSRNSIAPAPTIKYGWKSLFQNPQTLQLGWIGPTITCWNSHLQVIPAGHFYSNNEIYHLKLDGKNHSQTLDNFCFGQRQILVVTEDIRNLVFRTPRANVLFIPPSIVHAKPTIPIRSLAII